MIAKNWKCVVALCALAICLISVQAQAALVNFDINKALTYDGSTATSWSPTFTGAAVVGTGSQTWNALNQPNTSNPSTGSLAGLLDSDGNASAVTLPAFSLPNGDFRDHTGEAVPDLGYRNLMGDRPQGSGQASVTIRGLDEGDWDLYVFGWAGCFWEVTDGASPTVSQGWTVAYDGTDVRRNPASLIDGTDYIHFSGTHVAGTDLVLVSDTNTAPSNGYGQVRWAGFQINQVVIPEPSTFILLATGLLGLLAYAWRRRKR